MKRISHGERLIYTLSARIQYQSNKTKSGTRLVERVPRLARCMVQFSLRHSGTRSPTSLSIDPIKKRDLVPHACCDFYCLCGCVHTQIGLFENRRTFVLKKDKYICSVAYVKPTAVIHD